MLPALLLIISSTVSGTAAAQGCPTDQLKPLVGAYSGVASMVTFENGGFALQRPKALAPKAIQNRSTFGLDEADPCHGFHVKIDYLNPKWVADLSGNEVVREVRFDGGTTEQDGLFTIATDGVPQGHLRVIDDHTFMATFNAPNPLNKDQLTSCKEFISLTQDGKHIVRTIQCFDAKTGDFAQDRLTMESFQ